MKKGILVVSFGTSHPDTRKLTIEAIERRIGEAFPEYKVYRAFTSGVIIRKIKEQEGLSVMTVGEALEQMQKDGIRDVIIQPTHVINGVENDKMRCPAYHLGGQRGGDRGCGTGVRGFKRWGGAGAYGARNHPLCQRHLCGLGL